MTSTAQDIRTFRDYVSVVHEHLADDALVSVGGVRTQRAYSKGDLHGSYRLRGDRNLYFTNTEVLADLGPSSHRADNAGLASALVLDIDDPAAHATANGSATVERVRDQLQRAADVVQREVGAMPALEAFTGGGGLLIFPFSRAMNPNEYRTLVRKYPFFGEISDPAVLRPGALVRAIGSFNKKRHIATCILATADVAPIDVDALLKGVDVPRWERKVPQRRPRRHCGPRGGDVERGVYCAVGNTLLDAKHPGNFAEMTVV